MLNRTGSVATWVISVTSHCRKILHLGVAVKSRLLFTLALFVTASALTAPAAATDKTVKSYADVCEQTVLQPDTAETDRVFSDDFEYYSEPFAPPFKPVCVVNDFGDTLAAISKVDVNTGAIPMLVEYRGNGLDIYVGALADPAKDRRQADPFLACTRYSSQITCVGRPNSSNLFGLHLTISDGGPQAIMKLADREMAALDRRTDISEAFADFDDSRPAVLYADGRSLTFSTGFTQSTRGAITMEYLNWLVDLPSKTVVELRLPTTESNTSIRTTKFIVSEFQMIAQLMKYAPGKIPGKAE